MQQKIQTFLNTCLRRIFNIRWPEKIRNEELWERAGQEPVAKQILRRKWGWIGHTLRKPASSTTRQALTWNPQGKRKRGRPRNSWRRDTEAELLRDIFSLYMGQQLTVVLNGHKVIKEALVKQADVFSDRPEFGLVFLVTDEKGINASGAEWKTVRKAALEILREFGMGKNLLAEKIQEEVTEYIRTIASKDAQPFDMTHLTQISVSNNICSILYGKRFDYDDQVFKEYMKAMDANVAGLAILLQVSFHCRRVCLGESLARMELFLYLAAMIQHFRFLPPEDGQLHLWKESLVYVHPEAFHISSYTKTVNRHFLCILGMKWKPVRKACLEILRDLGMGKNLLAQKIQEEVTEYIRTIASKDGQPFDMTRLTQISVSNNICSMLYGKRFDYDDQAFEDCMKAMDASIAGQASLVAGLFPAVRHIPGDPFKTHDIIRGLRRLLNIFIQPIVARHIQLLDVGPNPPDDFITAYLRRVRQDEADQKVSYITEKGLPMVIFHLFAAGSETTAITLRWAVAYFLHHPDVQEKCHQEIRKVVGVDRRPTMQDRPEMMYLEATTTEVLRIASVAPLSVLHTTSCDVSFAGYTIPKGTTVIPNLDSVLYDSEVWEDPDTFRPEMFIGRRVCLGESLARMELFLYLAAMIQHFRFLPPEDGQLPSLEGILGLAFTPMPFTFRAVPRL
nr:hypothetical protein BaRGS_017082 [Batillaria attramentaria]